MCQFNAIKRVRRQTLKKEELAKRKRIRSPHVRQNFFLKKDFFRHFGKFFFRNRSRHDIIFLENGTKDVLRYVSMKLFDREFNETVESYALKQIVYDGIMIADADGIIRYFRQYNRNIIPYDVNEAVGKHILEIYTDIKEEDSTLLRALKGIPTLGEQTYQTAFNGQTCIFYEYTIPLKVSGRIVGAVSLAKFVASFTSEVAVGSAVLYRGNNEREGLCRASDILGKSMEIGYIRNQVRQIADTNSSVLITGETGTGKELVAQAIHTEGTRRTKSFVSQNCSAIPSTLLEGLLFGTAKGSFTGAEDRPGLFEIANGGTLLLDEINSMDVNMQAKILKVIEDKRVKRLGADREIPVDVRVISAMNEDPKTCIEQGRMRKDLFYRIAVVQIKIPPLRERREDIPVIADYFISHYNREMNKDVRGFTEEAKAALMGYRWPGNVRELRNSIEGALNFISSGYIGPEDLSDEITDRGIRDAAPMSGPAVNITGNMVENSVAECFNLTKAVQRYEKRLIEEAAADADSLHELAARLGISRQTLSYKLRKYRITLGK